MASTYLKKGQEIELHVDKMKEVLFVPKKDYHIGSLDYFDSES